MMLLLLDDAQFYEGYMAREAANIFHADDEHMVRACLLSTLMTYFVRWLCLLQTLARAAASFHFHRIGLYAI